MPQSLRINDHQALDHQNFELGYWLLELLLENSPPASLKLVELYNALVYYVTRSKQSAKARGIQLLLRILGEASAVTSSLDLSPLENMLIPMIERYNRESKDSGLLHSAYLQSLVELMTVVQLTKKTRDDDVTNVSLMEHLSSHKLNIVKATLYRVENRKQNVDITAEVQKVVDENFGSAMLSVPAQHSLCPYVVQVEHKLGSAAKGLEIIYKYVDNNGKVRNFTHNIVIIISIVKSTPKYDVSI